MPSAAEMQVGVEVSTTVALCVVSILIGSVAVFFKVLTIVIFCLSREMRQKYMLMMALDFGEIVNGVAFWTVGAGRASLLSQGRLLIPSTQRMPPHGQFAPHTTDTLNKPWPILLIIGAQLPALVTLFIAVERVVAVRHPSLYITLYTQRCKLFSIFIVILFQVLSLAWAILSSMADTEEWSSSHCPIISSVNKTYATVHFSFVLSAYVLSLLSVGTVYMVQCQLGVSEKTRRETRLPLFICTSASAIVFVAIPAVFMLAIRWNLFDVGEFFSSLSYLLPGCSVSSTESPPLSMAPTRPRKKVTGFKPPSPDHQSTIDDDGTQVETSNKNRKTKKKAGRGATVADGPTSKAAFKEFITNASKLGVQGLLAEFNDIKAQTQAIGGTPKIAFDINPDRNRYKDVYCVDNGRVVLTWPPGGNDYVHANWVEVCDGRKYICTQGPIEKTNEDLWRMVWQEKCKSIVMLCNVVECGKKKCEQYWPESIGQEMQFGQLKVSATGKEEWERLMTITQIKITDGMGGQHELEHIIWNNWPDRGVPADTLTCFKLLGKLKKLSPCVIHCSAGIGRTGTIVGLDLIYSKLMKGESANLKQIVMELRARRHGSVQMDIQYLYMHRVLIAFAINKKLMREDEVADFIKSYEVLCKQRGFL